MMYTNLPTHETTGVQDACAGRVFYPSDSNLVRYLPIKPFLAEDFASLGDL